MRRVTLRAAVVSLISSDVGARLTPHLTPHLVHEVCLCVYVAVAMMRPPGEAFGSCIVSSKSHDRGGVVVMLITPWSGGALPWGRASS